MWVRASFFLKKKNFFSPLWKQTKENILLFPKIPCNSLFPGFLQEHFTFNEVSRWFLETVIKLCNSGDLKLSSFRKNLAKNGSLFFQNRHTFLTIDGHNSEIRKDSYTILISVAKNAKLSTSPLLCNHPLLCDGSTTSYFNPADSSVSSKPILDSKVNYGLVSRGSGDMLSRREPCTWT